MSPSKGHGGFVLGALAALAGLAAVAVGGAYLAAIILGAHAGNLSAQSPLPLSPSLVAQGKYLAEAGDCMACHTAKGGATFAGGSPIQSPIGVIYTPNITPDPKTGIGTYSFGAFERVLRRGVRQDGRSLYPAMPYPSFSRLTDQDVAALYAYFMHGVAPVAQKNRPEAIPWPLSLRWPLTYWRWLFAPKPAPFAPLRNETPAVSRGAYLVEGLGHCGACHTPRALTLQEKALRPQDGPNYLAGSNFNGWYAPSLRSEDVYGLGLWTDAQIADFLKQGREGGFVAFGEMGDVVSHSTRFLNTADLDAIGAFLRTLPPRRNSPRLAKVAPPKGVLKVGEATYVQNCAVCHQASGVGEAGGFPALARNPVVNAEDPTSLIHLILKGGAIARTPNNSGQLVMPAFATSLSDQDLADVVSYVRSAWGNHAAPVGSSAVRALRLSLKAPEPSNPGPPAAAGR